MKIDGAPVVNATKKLPITITPRDVKLGETKDPGACAAARACMREAGATQARVHISTTYLKMDKEWVRYRTPAAIRSEIISFDRGAGFQPGDYVLRPLQPSHRASGKRMGGPDRAKPKTKIRIKRAKRHVVTGIRHHGAVR